MSDQTVFDSRAERAFTGLDNPRAYDGVRTRRIFSFIADYAFVLLLSIPAAIVVFFLGFLSFGLAWGLYAVLLPLIAIMYLAFTMGSAQQATPGMRLTGVRIARLDGAEVDPAIAVLHGVVFWASNTFPDALRPAGGAVHAAQATPSGPGSGHRRHPRRGLKPPGRRPSGGHHGDGADRRLAKTVSCER